MIEGIVLAEAAMLEDLANNPGLLVGLFVLLLMMRGIGPLLNRR